MELLKESEIHFLVTYNVVHEKKFFLISVISFLIFIVGIIQLTVKIDPKEIPLILVYYTILLIYFITLLIFMRKDHYQIPYKIPTIY